jgi:hypothetical protein
VTNSDMLLEKVQAVRATWPAVNLRDRRLLLNNLKFMWHCMRASEDMLSAASVRAYVEKNKSLEAYYTEHADEERRHDEWLARDLSTAGVYVDALPVDWIAASMVGATIYAIRYRGACALLGYMAVMECYSMTEMDLHALETEHGVPLLRTLRHHVVNDPDHGTDVRAQIDALNTEDFNLALQCALETAHWIYHACQRMLTDGAPIPATQSQE